MAVWIALTPGFLHASMGLHVGIWKRWGRVKLKPAHAAPQPREMNQNQDSQKNNSHANIFNVTSNLRPKAFQKFSCTYQLYFRDYKLYFETQQSKFSIWEKDTVQLLKWNMTPQACNNVLKFSTLFKLLTRHSSRHCWKVEGLGANICRERRVGGDGRANGLCMLRTENIGSRARRALLIRRSRLGNLAL